LQNKKLPCVLIALAMKILFWTEENLDYPMDYGKISKPCWVTPMVTISAIEVLFFRSSKMFGFDFHIIIWPDDFFWKSAILEACLC
jgi:hypothetical protein